MPNKKNLIIVSILIIVIVLIGIWLLNIIIADQKQEQWVAECSKRSPFECKEECDDEYVFCEVDDKCKMAYKASCPVCLDIISFCVPNN